MSCVENVTVEVIDGVCVDVIDFTFVGALDVIEVVVEPIVVVDITTCEGLWVPDGTGGLTFAGDVSIDGVLTVQGDVINPWVQLTQAEYDALPIPDPNTLYVIVG